MQGRESQELVAELAASFMCADLKFAYRGIEDHAGYVASWLSVLKNDNKAIFNFKAAALATVAKNYILKM